MGRCLIITFKVAPGVAKYLASQSVDLEKVLKSLKMDISNGVDTRLEIVDEGMLDQYGKEDNDYVIVRGMDKLKFWGYSLEEVCEDLSIGIAELRDLGVDLGIEEHRV